MTPLTRCASFLGVFTLLASTMAAQTTDQSGAPSSSMPPGEDIVFRQEHDGMSRHISLVAAASLLSGRFEGAGAGNDLALELQRLRDPRVSSVTLLVTVSGVYKGVSFERSDRLRVSSLGTSLEGSYRPDVDPNVERLASPVKRSGKDRNRRVCSVPFKPKGDGFIAETSCGDLFPGGNGRWTIELQPGTIRLRSLASSETLEFSRTGG